MTDAPLTPREAEDALAAEYVLGVLDAAERAEVEARIKREPAFAARVAEWEDKLSGLNEGFAEAPAPNLLPKIEARLFPKPVKTRRFGFLGWLSGAVVASDGSSAVSTGWRGLIDISFLFGARSGPVTVLIARSPRPSWSCGWCSSSGTRPAR